MGWRTHRPSTVVRDAEEEDPGRVAARIGTLDSVDLIGAIAGSLAGGFLLLPWLGSRGSLIVITTDRALRNCAARQGNDAPLPACLGGGAGRRIRLVGRAHAGSLRDLSKRPVSGAHRRVPRGGRRGDGERQAPTGGYMLVLDGNHQANDTGSMLETHRRIALLALALHPEAKDMLVVGLGGGATPGGVRTKASSSTSSSSRRRSCARRRSSRTRTTICCHGRTSISGWTMGAITWRSVARIQRHHGRSHPADTCRIEECVRAGVLRAGPRRPEAGRVRDAVGKRNGGRVARRSRERSSPCFRTRPSGATAACSWARSSHSSCANQTSTGSWARRGVVRVWRTWECTRSRICCACTRRDPTSCGHLVGDGPILTDDRPLAEYFLSLPRGRGPNLSGLKGDVRRHVR